MKIVTEAKIQGIEVEVKELDIIRGMISSITRGQHDIYAGKRKNGQTVLFYEEGDEYNEHRVHVHVITDDPQELEKLRCLLKLYKLMTGRNCCDVYPSKNSYAVADKQHCDGADDIY